MMQRQQRLSDGLSYHLSFETFDNDIVQRRRPWLHPRNSFGFGRC